MSEKQERVIVARAVVGICHMQVCAIDDATDEEILAKCNAENPSGTTSGWSSVCRDGYEFMEQNGDPVKCSDFGDRTHFLVVC